MKKSYFIFIILATCFAAACSTPGSRKTADGLTVFDDEGKRLSSKSVIEGRVVESSTGRGVKGARVEIKNANMGLGYYLRETDSSGNFSIDDFIPRIKYIIEVSAEGYVTYRSTGVISEGTQSITLEKEAVLSGVVRDSRGSPLAGVDVSVKRGYEYFEPGEKPVTTVSDQGGKYVFKKLTGGGYTVTFSKNGYITETARLKDIKTGEGFNLPMMMIRPAVISGKIKIEGIDAPAINMNVTAAGNVTYSAVTYQDGAFRLDDVKPGYYRLKITHEGFHTLESQAINITEGQSRDAVNFTVKPKEPQIEVYTHRYTFAPGNKLEFNLKSFRLESVRVAIYRVPIEVFLRGGGNPSVMDPQKEGFSRVARWEESINDFRPYEWKYQSLEIKNPLATGGYCVEVSGPGGIISRKFFTVTSIGSVVKRSPGSVFVYVTNLIDNSPTARAKIAVFDSTPEKSDKKKKKRFTPPQRIEELPIKIISSGETDADGVFQKNTVSGMYLSVLAIGPDGSYAICSSGSSTSFRKEVNRYFIYTDRPVYRAGDTVFYKVIGKKRDVRYVPLKNERIYYRIENIEMGKTIDEGTLFLDEWGTASSRIKLSPEINLGEYEIRTGPAKNNLYASGRFYAEQYRKPEFKIDITPSRDYFINGDTAEFKVEAKYFFGAPLKGALVKYRFYETKLRDADSRYWWEEEGESEQYYSKIKLEGEKYVDDNGIAVLGISAGSLPYDREITLEASVTDKSNITISSIRKIRVGRGEFYIKINPRQNFFSDREEKEIEVLTLDQAGKPVRATVNFELFRYLWKPWQRVYVHDKNPVYTDRVTTDAKGFALLKLPKKMSAYGEFDLVARATDRKENPITASRVVWIYSDSGFNVSSRLKNLEVSLNVTNLSRPQEVTCILKSRFTDSYVCITLEGRDVYEHRVVKMNGNIVPVKFNIKSAYAPNLFLTATMQRKRALYANSVEITLPVKDTRLRLEMKTAEQKYKPGDKARVEIKATDGKGRPVKADLSLAAVDEAIYQIRYDHTPKMQGYFYSRITNWVVTSYSYPITLLAGAGKDGKVKVREKFDDTAFWKANIRTDEKGLASVEFILPDNLTTWRLTARGHDLEGRVGENIHKFLVTQDLIARIGKPRFLTEGDSVSLIGIVNSNTERGLKKIDTEFKIDGSVNKPDRELAISLPAYGSVRNYYDYNVPAGKKEVKAEYRAVADSDARDALRLSIPVERRGVSYKMYGIGDMASGRKVTLSPLKPGDDFRFVPEEMTISLNPSPIVQMVRAAKFLSKYPYGCIEQTMNRFLPAAVLQKLMRQKGFDALVSDKYKKNLEDKVKSGLSRVQQMQNDDGTWGWWYGDRGNEFLTGFVMESLSIAASMGYGIDLEVRNRGIEAMGRILKSPAGIESDQVAYLIYVYSLFGKWNETAYAELVKRKPANSYQFSFLVRAIANVERKGILSGDKAESLKRDGRDYADRLLGSVKKDEKGIYWQSDTGQSWGWPGGDVEMTAHALSALVESGNKSTLASQAVRSLSRRSRGDAWGSTKETSSVMMAVCRYIESSGMVPAASGKVRFTLDGSNVADISYDIKDRKSMGNLKKKVELKSGKEKPEFVVEAFNGASPDASFDVVMKGSLYFNEKGIMSMFKSEAGSLRALSNGISITRAVSAITRVRDLKNNEYLVPQSLEEKRQIKIGDELLVKLRFTASDSFKYIVMEDYLPSGFEVVKNSAYDETPFVHSERWDNRMVFFFTNLARGEIYEVAYIIRAELPGKFLVKPARMECMYEPSIQGWSDPFIVEVEKK